MRRFLKNALGVVLCCVIGLAAAQTAAKAPAFEVSTVKLTPPVNDGRTHINYPAGGDFSASNVTVLELVSWAFDMPAKRIVGAPDWVSSQRFDIQAKSDADTSRAMLAMPGDNAHVAKRRMVQTLLRDRFGLKTHTEKQTLNALDLLVDGTPKLKQSTVPGKKWDMGRTHLHGYGLTAGTLADLFGNVTGKVVVDRTGLQGQYDVDLVWSSDDGTGPDTSAPGFFRAVPEQLGLKLVPAKEPLDVLVVDAVAQPTAN